MVCEEQTPSNENGSGDNAVAPEAEKETDCLACGNCCRSLGPMILPEDVDRMGKALRIKPSVVIERYLRTDEDGDRVPHHALPFSRQ